MPEENINLEQEQTQTTNDNYIEAISKLKSTTVSKELYDKAIEENKTLLDSIVNGMPGPSGNDTAESKPDLKQLKDALFKPEKELNNLEYITRALAYREALLEETGKDCFVGYSHLDPNFNKEEAEAQAQKVADVYEQCIQKSGGNPEAFTLYLQQRTNDVVLPRRKK